MLTFKCKKLMETIKNCFMSKQNENQFKMISNTTFCGMNNRLQFSDPPLFCQAFGNDIFD